MAVNKSDFFSSKILDFQGNQFPIVHEGRVDWKAACSYRKDRGDVCRDLPTFFGERVQNQDSISW